MHHNSVIMLAVMPVLCPSQRTCAHNDDPSCYIRSSAVEHIAFKSSCHQLLSNIYIVLKQLLPAQVCVLGDHKHCEEAKSLGVDAMSVEDLKKLNKNKKLVKKLGEPCLCVQHLSWAASVDRSPSYDALNKQTFPPSAPMPQLHPTCLLVCSVQGVCGHFCIMAVTAKLVINWKCCGV